MLNGLLIAIASGHIRVTVDSWLEIIKEKLAEKLRNVREEEQGIKQYIKIVQNKRSPDRFLL